MTFSYNLGKWTRTLTHRVTVVMILDCNNYFNILNAMKQPAVYIVTNKKNGTLYTGVTSNLIKRIFEHKEGFVDGFTKKYDCKMLVWYEVCDSMLGAIEAEKKVKNLLRKKKIELIEKMNSDWLDLYDSIC
jgi:putative endonuclease